MFILRTGLQGHSKTLNTIKELDKRAKETGRVVYFHNVTDLDVNKLEGTWIPFDHPKTWFDLPDNVLIVIDEAQQHFPVRGNGTAVPPYASRLEIMRKQGHELHCITQHPTLIDAHMRKLCNGHIHYNRPNKGKVISRWQFERPANIDQKSAFADGQLSVITLDKKYFDVYTSAAAGHHFKWQPPRALFVLIGCAVLLGLAVLKLSGRFTHEEPAPEAAPVETVEPAHSKPTQQPGVDHVMSAQEYVDARTPRIPDLASSAPIYDDLTKPVSFPKPFCVSSHDPQLLYRNAKRMTIKMREGRETGCACNSQQGTRLDVSFEFCMDVVENGYFDATRPDRQQAGGMGGRAEERGRRQDASAPTGQPAPVERAVTVVQSGQPGLLW